MWITAFITDNGAPKTGLSPIIMIRKVSDNSLIVNNGSMLEIGNGWYKYELKSFSKISEHVILIDANSDLIQNSERYQYTNYDYYKR